MFEGADKVDETPIEPGIYVDASSIGAESPFTSFDPLKEQKLRIFDENGIIIEPRWMPDLPESKVIDAYRAMVFARVADAKEISLQRQGRLYTLPPNQGQEASAAVGSAFAHRNLRRRHFRLSHFSGGEVKMEAR